MPPQETIDDMMGGGVDILKEFSVSSEIASSRFSSEIDGSSTIDELWLPLPLDVPDPNDNDPGSGSNLFTSGECQKVF
jgi:hypothetical protein